MPVINGTAGDDVIDGTEQDDIISGQGGNDTIIGANGNDTIIGGTGNDTLNGGGGNDWIYGFGDDGVDTMSGGDGDDIFAFNIPSQIVAGDAMDGGAGYDAIDIPGSLSVTYDFSGATITGVERITAGGDTGSDVIARVTGAQLAALTDAVGHFQLAAGATVSLAGLTVRAFRLDFSDSATVLDLTGATTLDGNGNPSGTVLFGGAADDTITGGEGADLIAGYGGNDTLRGGGGDDTLYGGSGVDALYGGAGNDHIVAVTGESLEPGSIIDGGTGDDTLTMDTIYGGVDLTSLTLSGVEHLAAYNGTGGFVYISAAQLASITSFGVLLRITDGGSISFAGKTFDPGAAVYLSDVGTTVDLTGVAGGTAFVVGGAGNDALNGSAGVDILSGGDGSDVLIGGQGGDSIDGGAGIDTASYAGAAGAVSVDLGAGTASDGDQLDEIENLLGSNFGDTLTGNAGANVLNGGAGSDAMAGLGGDDSYYVDNAGDVVSEGGGGGAADRVLASVTYALAAGQYLEILRTTNDAGTGAINLTGNDLAQTITGNAGVNVLAGLGGNDVLDGLAGNDTMAGGLGNDTYYLDTAGDVITELAGQGTDTVLVGFSYALAAGSAVENLATTDADASTAINLTGNAGANTLTGNAGANVLNGGAGSDTMAGLGGDDRYYVDSAADVVSEAVGDGADRVFASVSYTLTAGAHVELLTTTNNAGTSAINLTGNEFANTIYGNGGANVLDGKGGADILVGFGGDDWYYVDNALDRVTEGAAEGTADRVFASASYTLGAGVHVETLTTTDNAATAAINLTGNELGNRVYGNAGANLLDGRAGNDTLVGLAGNDTLVGGLGNDTMTGGLGDDLYYVDSAADVVNEVAGQGTADRVLTSVSYALNPSAEIEVLTTSNNAGTGAINLTGNALANTIYGNAGANVLDGRGGTDTLVGFGGDDWFYVDNAGDVVSEAAGGGNDRVFASVSYTLSAAAQVELLTTSNNGGTGAIDLAGNMFANTIYGNAGANVLDGKGGADILVGLAGADSFAFTTAPGGGNVDTVTDFAVADDTIVLENAVFAGLAAGALAAGAFATGGAATEADDRIVYNAATGALLFDADGSGAGLARTSADIRGI
jgi:serralysin